MVLGEQGTDSLREGLEMNPISSFIKGQSSSRECTLLWDLFRLGDSGESEKDLSATIQLFRSPFLKSSFSMAFDHALGDVVVRSFCF